jgi:outer membrane receptor protein involved in Fe transport
MSRRLLLVVFATLFAAATAVAQQTGSIKGTVKDETGAALQGVTVTATGPATKTAVSASDGSFHVDGLPAGTYKVTAQLTGFGQGEQGSVSVSAGGSADVPFTLLVVLRGEEVVVSGSKIEERLVDAPVTMSVITSDTLAASPAQNFGDLLRAVPGTNVVQTSARDINIVSREATATLTNSQLALVDGRSIYLDFFGLILWDFVPTNSSDIKQIEVIRGPASVVWGANALTGVINIITKSPREAQGGTVVLSGGSFSRDAGDLKGKDAGSTFGGSLSWAGAPNDTWSYKIAGGYYFSDPMARPSGTVPVCGPNNPCLFNNPVAPNIRTGGAPYPPFQNTKTSQPKADLRVDQDLSGGGRITYNAGYAGTQGIIHTGIGPFDIQSGSFLVYTKVGYTKGSLKLNGFWNHSDATAPNLLQVDAATGQQLQLNFKTDTFDLEVGNSNVVANRHILTYGGNVRRNNFDITITPLGENRSEFGAYFQDEIFFDQFRIALGARVDKFGNLDKAVFSPRASFTYKPAPSHAFRASFNKAFRAPSLINNFLDTRTFVPVDLSGLTQNLALALGAELLAAGVPPSQVPGRVAQLLPALLPSVRNAFGTPTSPRGFPLVLHSLGSDLRAGDGLKEESLKAYEVAYTGTFGGKTTVQLAFYINDRNNNINFVTDPVTVRDATGIQPYSSRNTPPGWPQAPVPTLQPLLNGLVDVLGAQGVFLPTTATYLNLAETRNKGFEASIDHAFNREWSAYANYSYQAYPKAKTSSGRPFPVEEFVVGPKSRFNAGVNWNSKRFVGTASVNYADKAFWTDVLSSQFFGPTDAYTMVNATFGVKWGKDGKIVTSIKGNNLTNDDIQQHVFGDIVKRSLVGELRVGF